jgi:hypothetical protein
LEIEDHFAAQSALRVEPHGKGIVRLDLFNSPSHMPRGLRQENLMMQGHIRQFGPPLSARYEIEVCTKEPEPVQIEVTQL